MVTVDLAQLDLAEGHQRVEQRDRRLLRRERRLGFGPPPELPVEVLQRVRRAQGSPHCLRQGAEGQQQLARLLETPTLPIRDQARPMGPGFAGSQP